MGRKILINLSNLMLFGGIMIFAYFRINDFDKTMSIVIPLVVIAVAVLIIIVLKTINKKDKKTE